MNTIILRSDNTANINSEEIDDMLQIRTVSIQIQSESFITQFYNFLQCSTVPIFMSSGSHVR